MKRKVSGFILIEICIALLIFGMLSGSLSPLVKTFERYRQKDHLEKLVYALANFAAKNSRLPCPGNGAESYPCTASEGILPYKTLEIPESWVRDPSGKSISYKVNPDLTHKGLKMDYRPKGGQSMIQGDHQTFCYAPLEHGDFKSAEGVPIAFQLEEAWYPRDIFIRFYMKWVCVPPSH